ncbi:hypothetical protein Ancab_018863 [Ancistrocladus abbreviatus]
MALGIDVSKVESWDIRKLKDRKKKDEDVVEDTGCWIKLRFIGSCSSSRLKNCSWSAESKTINDASRDQPTATIVSSTTTSNAESRTSTSKLEEELKVPSWLLKFTFNDLKLATRNFRPQNLLGEGGFGYVFKG